jgi:hypothetical protein
MIISTKSMRGLVLRLSLLTGGLLLSGPGSATVTLTDDADFGPNTVIRDVDNARDFLRLDFTTPYTYEEIVYLTEVGFAGDFEGWRVASQAQLEELGLSAGIVQGSTDPAVIARATELRDWFCESCVRNEPGTISVNATGLLRDSIIRQPEGVDEVVQVAFSIGERHNVEPHEASFRTTGWGRDFWRGEEIFLVRDDAASVPDSAAFPICSYGNYHPSCWWYRHWEPGLFNPWVYGWFPYPRPYSYGGYRQPIYGWFPHRRPFSYGGYRQPIF